MRMSISDDVGPSSRASATASRAVGGLADDLDVGLGVEEGAEAGADQRLVVGEQRRVIVTRAAVQRQRGAHDAKPPSAAGPGVDACRRGPWRVRASRAARARPPAVARVAPRPLSVTSMSNAASVARGPDARARVASACRSTLVSDSCTIRNPAWPTGEAIVVVSVHLDFGGGCQSACAARGRSAPARSRGPGRGASGRALVRLRAAGRASIAGRAEPRPTRP